QGGLEILIGGRISYDRMPGPHFARYLAQGCCTAARTDRLDTISLRLTLEQVNRAGADRTGCPKDGDPPHAGGWFGIRSDSIDRSHVLTIPATPVRVQRSRHAAIPPHTPQVPQPRTRRAGPSRRHDRE